MIQRKSTFILFLLVFLFFSFTASATTYYLSSSSGNDSNSGTDPSSPWQTLDKLNSFQNLQPGDNVLFKRGDVFYGSIVVSNSGSSGNPITYSAYGSGNKPVITGFTSITSWANLGGNIWESNDAVSTLPYTNMVEVNGVNKGMGRYPNSTGPNTGYLYIKSHSGNSSITADGLGSNNWTSAGIVIRKQRWALERGTIISQYGNTLNYTDPAINSPQDGFGFFIQNDPKTLDVNGEWYYNPSTHRLRIYSTSMPGDVKIATVKNLVAMDRQSYIVFDNLTFTGSNSDALYCANYGTDLTVQNCNISFAGLSGIWSIMRNTVVQNNDITDANYLGVYTTETNATIQYNNLSNINVLEGMDQELTSAGAIVTVGANAIIAYNQINNCGYSGIKFEGLNTKVTNNFVNRFCLIKEDGGGIDMSARDLAKGSLIDGNIVLNGIGAKAGTSDTTSNDFGGIFIDAYGTDITISNNTVANCATAGIKLHGASNIIVKNNTTYNNGGASWVKGGLMFLSGPEYPIRNITLEGNIFFARTTDQVAFFGYPPVGSTADDLKLFGTGDNNYYAKPIDPSTAINIDNKFYDVSAWKSFSNQDANSNPSAKSVTDVNDIRFEYNATSSSKTIALDGNYIDVKNVSYNGTITLKPYTSCILIRNGAAKNDSLLPAVDPSNTVNGIDYDYYEGSSFSIVPDFSKLTAVKNGSASNFDINVANRAEIFAINFSGFIDVPTDGQYTFYTSSDDGSMLYIDNHLVVNNDGEHGMQENSGIIGLKAGKHAISVGYTQQKADASLSVSYSASGISKQLIPSSSLYRVSKDGLLPAVNPSNIVNGISYKYYEGTDFRVVPDFSVLTPVKTGTVTNFNISTIPTRAEMFGVNYNAYINVPEDGQYTFYTSSDDGSMLYIDNHLVVNNDGEHAVQERSGTIGLKAGKHLISVGYSQQKIDAVLTVSYSGPGISKQIIPSTQCYRVAAELLPAVNPSSIVNGLDFKYYEANNYQVVPDFNSFTPVKTGTSSNFDISLANRSTAYSFNFSGFIDVPSDGEYTFYTTSDDGSILYIDNVPVVNNDGLHSSVERGGMIGLKAGKHSISLAFFQQSGDNVLSVAYEGPGVSKQEIPSSALYRTSASNNLLTASYPTSTVNGLDYKYYEAASYNVIPDFNANTPVKTGSTNTFDISVSNRSAAYSLSFTGYINVPADGEYTFYTTSDDGSNLSIDNIPVVDNNGIHTAIEQSGTVGLKAGKHLISVGFFQQLGDNVLSVSYEGPGISKQVIPSSALFRMSPLITQTQSVMLNSSAGMMFTSDSTNFQMQRLLANRQSMPGVKVYPNPFKNSIQIDINGGAASKFKLALIDASGKTLWSKDFENYNGNLHESVNTTRFPIGVYFLRLIGVDNKTTVTKLLKEY